MEDKSYQFKIVNQLVADHELFDDLARTDAVELVEENVFRRMTVEQQVALYTTMVLKGESMPYYMLLRSVLTAVRPYFRDAYLCPLNVTLHSEASSKVVALTFAQFKVLSEIFRGTFPDQCTPLINSRVEYWYLVCLANITVTGGLFKLPNETVCYEKISGNLVRKDLEWVRMDVDKAAQSRLSAFEALYGVGAVPFANRIHNGHARYPAISLNMETFSLTSEEVRANLNYWQLFCGTRQSSTEINNIVGCAVVQACDPRPEEELPSVISEHEGGEAVQPLLSGCSEEVTVLRPSEADYFGRLASCGVVCVKGDGAAPAKPCEHINTCPQSAELEDDKPPDITEREARDVEDIVNTIRPQPLGGVVADYVDERGECGRLRYELQSGFVVLLEDTSWQNYIAKQAKLSSRDSGNHMQYQPTDGYCRRLSSCLLRWKEKNKHDPYGSLKKLPPEVHKWTDLFVKTGLIVDEGRVHQGNQSPKSGNVQMLEITPRSFGAALAAIETGVCTAYSYLPYFDSDPIRMDYGDLHVNLLKDSPVSGTTLTSLFGCLVSEENYVPKYSLLIVDVPILRADDKELSMKQLIGRNISQTRLEDEVDIPLGDQCAIVSRLEKISGVYPKVLTFGGALLFSLNLVLVDKAVLSLYEIVRQFERFKFIRSPYSKMFQREVYVCCFGYMGCMNKSVLYPAFLNFVVRFNTKVVNQINVVMTEMLKRRVCLYAMPRILGCRRHLTSYKGLIAPPTYKVLFVGDRMGAQHTLQGTRAERSAALTSILYSDIMRNCPEDPNRICEDEEYWQMMHDLLNQEK